MLQDISDYYNKQKKEINLPDDVTLKFVEKNNKKQVEIYDTKKKKLIIKSSYHVIGLYNTSKSIWYWGWFIDFVDRNLVDKSKEIKKWGKKMFNEKKPKDKQEQALYFYTKMGSFMTNSLNVNFLLKLALYIMKGKYFFPVVHSEDDSNIVKEFILI